MTFSLRGSTAFIFICICMLLRPAGSVADSACNEPRGAPGVFFSKVSYVHAPLPQFEVIRHALPAPIYDDNPLWVETYWKAWELAFRNFHEPDPDSGFVSQFIDAAFNKNIFLWDSAFMTMFTNFGAPLVPGVSTLDNFYARQDPDGEICREIVRATGVCYSPWLNSSCEPLVSRSGWSASRVSSEGAKVSYSGREAPSPRSPFTLDALNNPILAWAELESYEVTGDKRRLAEVWEPLVRYYRSLQKYLRQGNGLYMTDWASMDNSPRNPYLEGGGIGIDISAEMVLFARDLSDIASVLGKPNDSRRFTAEANELARLINRRLWEPKKGFYFDLTLGGDHVPVRTIAAYWTLIARVASAAQANQLVSELRNPKTFGRPNPVPTLAANEPQYDPNGGYWRGSVWAPTTTMVIRGLEAYGHDEMARDLALRYLNVVADVYEKTGTIWENYSAERSDPGRPARRDFVGWSGIGPIMYLLEYGIGLYPHSGRNELVWSLNSHGRQGCERYRFNGHLTTLIAQPISDPSSRFRISVVSDGAYTLRISHAGAVKTISIIPGEQSFMVE